MKQRTVISIVVLALLIGGGIGWAIKANLFKKDMFSPQGQNCTLEAMICPDGSAVGRTGPNCSFAACPTTASSTTSTTSKSIETSQVLSYRNTKLGFSLSYPKSWSVYESPEELYPGISIQPENPENNPDDRFSDIPYVYADVFVMNRDLASVQAQYEGKALTSNLKLEQASLTIGTKKAHSFRYSNDEKGVRNIYLPLDADSMVVIKTERFDMAEVKGIINSLRLL